MKLLFFGLPLALAISILFWQNLKISTRQRQPKSYQRVITLAPSFCETMVALQQAHRLVGVTSHCEAKSLAQVKRVGTFSQANIEAILQLKPDLVLAIPHAMAMNTIAQLLEHGIEVYTGLPDSLAEIENITLDLAQKFGVKNRGVALNQEMASALMLAQFRMRSANIGPQNNRTLIAIAAAPLVVAGTSTFSSQILERFGLTNMAESSSSNWPIWSLEKLLLDPPDVMIIAQGAEYWPQYQTLFRNLGIDLNQTRIRFVIPSRPIFESPSPRLIDDIKYFSELVL